MERDITTVSVSAAGTEIQKNNKGKILYNDNFIPDPEYTEIDGTETKSYITKLCISFIKDTLAYGPDTLIKMFF